MNRSYEVTLATNKDAPVEWQSSRPIESRSHRDAALLAFALAPHGHPARSAFRKNEPVYAWVWEQTSPRHSTGAPICVHAIELRQGERAVTQCGTVLQQAD